MADGIPARPHSAEPSCASVHVRSSSQDMHMDMHMLCVWRVHVHVDMWGWCV